MAFDREAYLEAKKAKKKRQKENKKKPKVQDSGSFVSAPRKVRATSPKPRVHDDYDEQRIASRLSPEDRAALNIPQFSGGLMRPNTTFSTPPRGKKSPTYRSAGAASGAKELPLDLTEQEFTCPTCNEVKHESQRNPMSKLGKCVDCLPRKK